MNKKTLIYMPKTEKADIKTEKMRLQKGYFKLYLI